MKGKTWKNLSEWKRCGIERGYEQRNPTSLYKSENKEEKSWYTKGNKERWLMKFNFIKKYGAVAKKWKNFEKWKKYGIERGYEQRNPASLFESENKEEKSWYRKGNREHWLGKFSFNRFKERWKTFEEWKRCGVERGYEQRNPASLFESENKEEKKWYVRGYFKGWWKMFNFSKPGRWKTFEEWKKYGIERSYEQRNQKSLRKSENEEERKWFNKGSTEKWLGEFNFIGRFIYSKDNEKFQRFIEKNENALRMVYAATNANSFGYDIEKIIMNVYDKKFKDQKELHDLLKNNADKIKALVENGVTNLGAYIGAFSIGERKIFPIVEMAVDSIPMDKLTGPLEKRVTNMLKICYSPKFNDNPFETIKELEEKIYSSNEKMNPIYEGLLKHYREVAGVMEELG